MWQGGKPLEFWTFAPFIDGALAAIPGETRLRFETEPCPWSSVWVSQTPLPGRWDELGQGSVGLIGKDYAGNEYQEP